MRIAVVIPVYNRAGIILETLRSVARQSLQPTSLIVVDDGSKDGTADAVQAWFDYGGACLSGWVLRQSYNGGASVARNVGFDGFQTDASDAIAFLDSDDIWPHQFLASAAEALQRAPDAVAAIANSVEITAGGVGGHQLADEVCADPLSYIFGKGCALLSCGLFRATAVRQCRPFDPLLLTGQDIPFMIDLARQGRWLPLDCHPVQRRRNLTHKVNSEGHLSERFPDRFMRWAKIYHRELIRLSPDLHRADMRRLRKYCASRWIFALQEAVRLGNPGRALICYAKALWLARPAGLPWRAEKPLTELRFPCRRLVPRRVATYRTLFGNFLGVGSGQRVIHDLDRPLRGTEGSRRHSLSKRGSGGP
jgi:glycosyltransferase involved in cell wall biosynthesis